MATIISIASLTTSAITVPKPLMMAQSSRKYSINISIVLSFLSLKVSHFLRDSKGFRCLLPISTQSFCLTEQPSAASPILHQCSFPSMQKLRYSDNQYYINTENLNFRFYNNQKFSISSIQQIRISESLSIRKIAIQSFRQSDFMSFRQSDFMSFRQSLFQSFTK